MEYANSVLFVGEVKRCGYLSGDEVEILIETESDVVTKYGDLIKVKVLMVSVVTDKDKVLKKGLNVAVNGRIGADMSQGFSKYVIYADKFQIISNGVWYESKEFKSIG